MLTEKGRWLITMQDLDREEAQELEQSRKALTQVSAEEALARHKSLREKQKAAASRKNAKLFRLGTYLAQNVCVYMC